jgi:uncharacterized repeat protein (TIGR03803 family)
MRLKSIYMAAGIMLLIGMGRPGWAQGIETQHTFTGTPDGASPLALVWTNGLLYGETSGGGTIGDGSIFTFDTNGAVFKTLFNFTNASDQISLPNNVLVTANMIYGTTELDGTNNVGMIYAMSTNGTGFTPLYSFGAVPDGSVPKGGLVLSGTTLFGTTSTGGTNDDGAVFKINSGGGGYAILHSFTNSPDGSSPQGGLVLGGSRLYGTTSNGGTNSTGTIYAINTDGSGYTELYSFTNPPDGLYPHGELVLANGVLYGVCSSGGTNNTGAIFAINTNGSGYKVLYSMGSFTGNTDGTAPQSTMTLSGSYLFGSAVGRGINGGGTVFLINTNGTGFTALASFTSGAASGSDPLASPIRVGNSIWGTTYSGSPSTAGTLYQLPMPAITMEPQSLTVTNTSPATFTMNAADDTAFTYKWYFNTNTLLAGQTTNFLTLAHATNNNAGTYTVVVSDSLGSVTSSPAVLTVIVPGVPPSITSQPQNYTVIVSNTASFTNAASGTPPLYYQWYFNTNTLLGGQTNPILIIPSAQTGQAGYYTVIVTNLYGSATSSAALLTVNVGTKPAITQQPQNYTVTNGLTATFTNAASGTAPLFFAWYFNTNTLVSSGINDTILTINPATTNQAGYYTVIVTNLYGSAASGPARLTVIVPATKPTFTQQPENYIVTNGYNATFTNAANGTLPLSYQWYFNTNTAVAGGTNAILTITFATTNQAGYYTVVASNIAGSVTSSPASLTVISTKPIIFTQPAPATVANGAPFSFTVVAAGQNPLRYQWYTNVVFGLSVQVGKTNSTLSNAAASSKLQAYYIVVVTNQLGKATSSPAFLTVLTQPVMTLQPLSIAVTNGDPVTFTSSAAGAGPLAFQWYFHTNTLITGATNTWLTFTNAIASLAGFYDVRVTNTFGAVTSSYALLMVSNYPNLLSFAFANGSASFAYANLAKSTNRLWVTTNLTSASSWQVLATNVMATNGLWFFTDPNPTTNSQRFYRFSGP